MAVASLGWISVISLREGRAVSVPFSHHLLSAPITSNLEASLPIHPSQFNLLSLVQSEGSQFTHTHVRMPNYQLAIKEAHSYTDIIIQLCESEEWSLSKMLAFWATSKRPVFISDHYTLMTDQFDHLPILWDKQKESLSAFHGHLSFPLAFTLQSWDQRKRGGDILQLNTERKGDPTSVFSNR